MKVKKAVSGGGPDVMGVNEGVAMRRRLRYDGRRECEARGTASDGN